MEIAYHYRRFSTSEVFVGCRLWGQREERRVVVKKRGDVAEEVSQPGGGQHPLLLVSFYLLTNSPHLLLTLPLLAPSILLTPSFLLQL